MNRTGVNSLRKMNRYLSQSTTETTRFWLLLGSGNWMMAVAPPPRLSEIQPDRNEIRSATRNYPTYTCSAHRFCRSRERTRAKKIAIIFAEAV